MSRRRYPDVARSRTTTEPVPRESLEQTVEWWRAIWEAQRREEERRGR